MLKLARQYRLTGLFVLAVIGVIVGLRYQSAEAETAAQPAVTRAASSSGPVQAETYQWRPVAIGAGGFITGLSMSANGDGRVARADVYGAYRWVSSLDRWVQLINSDSMPAASQVQDGGNAGVYEIIVAPSDARRLYMAFKGGLYRSNDGGAKFVAIPLTTDGAEIAFDANGQWRHNGPVIAVSPHRPDLVFFGSPANGLWRSDDAGLHWTRILGVPAVMGNAGQERPGIPIWIVPSPDAGKPEIVWAMVPGVGMMRSDDSGLRFTALCPTCTVAPKYLRQGIFTSPNNFLGVDDAGKVLWRFHDGVWMNSNALSPLKSAVYASIAVDTASAQIYVFDEGGSAIRSSDEGASWKTINHASQAGQGDPPWLRASNQSFFATAKVSFDPVVKHRAWVGAGTGVYYADVDPAARQIHWISQSRGIEELVANDVVQPTGAAAVFAAWDFGIHVKPNLDAFSTTYGPKERVLIAAQQLDWSASAPGFIVTNASDTRTTCCSADGDAVLAGYSADGGIRWTKFASLPTPPGTVANDPWRMAFGTIAVSSGDAGNIVWQPSNNRSPFFTKDQGRSWTRVVFPGETLPFTGSHAVYSYARKNLTADRVRPGVFYMVHAGEASNPQLQGVWRTENGGAQWQRVHAGAIAPLSQYSAKLRAVPGHAGHLFFTTGVASSPDNALRRSIDGGVSWTTLPQVQRVDDIAFGKPAAGASYPTMFISAQVSGQYGIWRSTTQGESWQAVAGFPIGTLDQVTVVGADPDVFGRVYIGYKGSGWRYGQPASCTAARYTFPQNAECFQVK